MENKGAADNLSEESKKALQSETWQKVREGIKEKREVEHFTSELTGIDNAYGWTWNQVVNAYLRTGHKEESSVQDVVVLGVIYKVLKRPKVTVFYDADGNTLFDVTNERLEKEYEWMMNSGIENATEDPDIAGEDDPIAEPAEIEKDAGEAPSQERMEEDQMAEDGKPAKQWAKEKLEKEKKDADDKAFAEPVIGYLLKRCEEDEGLAQDVVQEHKTWKKCFDYIYSRARKQAKGNCTAVRDDVVYEWAEDYYHKDDKAEEEKKAKKAAGDKGKKVTAGSAKKARSVAGRKTVSEKDTADKAEKVPALSKAEAPKEPPKPKRNGKEMDGQLDMFAMMGM